MGFVTIARFERFLDGPLKGRMHEVPERRELVRVPYSPAPPQLSVAGLGPPSEAYQPFITLVYRVVEKGPVTWRYRLEDVPTMSERDNEELRSPRAGVEPAYPTRRPVPSD